MSNNLAIVVIPIYKSNPNWNEIFSFNQCLKILYMHPISIVTHNELDISFYENKLNEISSNYRIEYFDKCFFESIEGYNRLMLSLGFYKRFSRYNFMLIYQLDAFVFNDNLDYWCNQGYDYIGAPWFEHFSSHEEGNKLWTVGNGGFSLRKIQKFIYILSYLGPVSKPRQVLANLSFKKSTNKIFLILRLILMCLGYKNNVRHYVKTRNNIFEDHFYYITFKDSWIYLKVPPVDIALKFSFERSPEYLYRLNKNNLPFGGHAWEKNQYNEFWKKYM